MKRKWIWMRRWNMTKQTYRDLMEELQAENMELKRQIRDLKKQLEMQVFDERPLDTIITDYKEQKKELSIPTMKATSLSMPASEFMSQYRKYRQLIKEEVNQTKIEIDTSGLSSLKNLLKQKPA